MSIVIKNIFATGFLLAASTRCWSALLPGDSVSIDALSKSTPIKGTVSNQWNTNEVYILECWATWCVPCVAAIPHVDALYDKYHTKGLNIIGVNVFEDERQPVASFVKTKGEGMSYPVIYTGVGGRFEEEWLKPAGIVNIPNTFVVKNGKLLFTIHPTSISDKMIETLLAGGEAEALLVQKIHRATKAEVKEEISKSVKKFSVQMESRDFAAANATISKIRELNENDLSLPGLELSLAAAQEKWEDVLGLLKTHNSSMHAVGLGLQIDSGTNAIPQNVLEAVVGQLANLDGSDAIGFGIKASLLSQLHRKEESLIAAEKAVTAFTKMSKDTLKKELFNGYLDSYKSGKPMRIFEVFDIVRQAMSKGEKTKESKETSGQGS